MRFRSSLSQVKNHMTDWICGEGTEGMAQAYASDSTLIKSPYFMYQTKGNA